MDLTTQSQVKLKRSVTSHEGRKQLPYFDTAIPPRITIGIGYNLSDRGLSDDWIDGQYESDVEYFYSQLCSFPWFKTLNEDRQIALIDMCFMGWQKFLEFTEMIAALSVSDFSKAASEILNSKWATQVKGRANTIAQVILNGVYDI